MDSEGVYTGHSASLFLGEWVWVFSEATFLEDMVNWFFGGGVEACFPTMLPL